MPQPHFVAGIGISSSNVESNNFWTAQPILVLYSSNNAAPRKDFGREGRKVKFAFGGVINKKSPKTVSTAKVLHCITF
jgi:hypothetical protein